MVMLIIDIIQMVILIGICKISIIWMVEIFQISKEMWMWMWVLCFIRKVYNHKYNSE
jgi:hypothetical protein